MLLVRESRINSPAKNNKKGWGKGCWVASPTFFIGIIILDSALPGHHSIPRKKLPQIKAAPQHGHQNNTIAQSCTQLQTLSYLFLVAKLASSTTTTIKSGLKLGSFFHPIPCIH